PVAPLLIGDASGVLDWFKPKRPGDTFFPDGFTLTRNALLGRYERPKPGTRVLAFDPVRDNGRATLADGGFPTIDQLFTLLPSNTVPPNATLMSLHFNLTTGLFNGTFRHPTTHIVTALHGAVFQADASGSGFFLGAGAADGGAVDLNKSK